MTERQKQLRDAYKNRRAIGGVYQIVNSENGRFLLGSTDDLQGTHNQMQFTKMTDSCTDPRLRDDWNQFGKDAFSVEELERLEQGENQTREEFLEDLAVLLAYWDEKLPSDNRY